jgi:hypothetical protein
LFLRITLGGIPEQFKRHYKNWQSSLVHILTPWNTVKEDSKKKARNKYLPLQDPLATNLF